MSCLAMKKGAVLRVPSRLSNIITLHPLSIPEVLFSKEIYVFYMDGGAETKVCV